MAVINPSSVRNVTGSEVDLAVASAGGDTLNLSGVKRAFLLLHNNSGSTVTATLAVPGLTWNGHPAPDTVVTVPGGSLVIVPVGSEEYADQSGNCAITYSSTTGVRVAAATT